MKKIIFLIFLLLLITSCAQIKEEVKGYAISQVFSITEQETEADTCETGWMSETICRDGNIMQKFQSRQKDYNLQKEICVREFRIREYCEFGCVVDYFSKLPVCKSEYSYHSYYKKCVNNNIWWFDSFNEQEKVAEWCQNGCIENFEICR